MKTLNVNQISFVLLKSQLKANLETNLAEKFNYRYDYYL